MAVLSTALIYQRVEAMARIARDLGHDMATVEDAKQIFGLK